MNESGCSKRSHVTQQCKVATGGKHRLENDRETDEKVSRTPAG